VPVEDIQRKIREIDSSQEDPEFLPFISEKLRELVNIPKPENKLNHNNEQNKMNHENLKNDLKEIENKLNHNNEQMLQTLLAEIKNLKK